MSKRVVMMFAAITLLIASTAQAQTADYVLRVYNMTAPTVAVSTTTILATNVVCGQAPPPSNASTKNPGRWVVADPADATKVCVYTDPGNGPLKSLPATFANYEATVTFVQGGVETAESNRAPFSRTPAAPASFRVVQ